jgi:ankyrin repeat protein
MLALLLRRRRLNNDGMLVCLQLILHFLLVESAEVLVMASVSKEDNAGFERFLYACSNGQLDVIERDLIDNPDYVDRQSAMGESCLHAAALRAQTAVTTRLLQASADPNVRTVNCRMHPLAWNALNGHLETARALLVGGASVNLDIDHMVRTEEKVTVLDIMLEILQDHEHDEATHRNDPTIGKYFPVRDLLLEYGGKRYKDLGTEASSEYDRPEL